MMDQPPARAEEAKSIFLEDFIDSPGSTWSRDDKLRLESYKTENTSQLYLDAINAVMRSSYKLDSIPKDFDLFVEAVKDEMARHKNKDTRTKKR